MAPKIERISGRYRLGEGPHWDVATQSLYFVDILNHYLVKYHPATNTLTEVSTEEKQPSIIIPVEGKPNQFIITANAGLSIVSWDGQSDQLTIIEDLGTVDPSPNVKFNDGKCDSRGRLWAGTMNITWNAMNDSPASGSLYSYNQKREIKIHENNIKIANGIAFNNKIKKMFYVDSVKKGVDRFDYDIENGTVSNREVWFSLPKNNLVGFPDGITIDADGNIWVAVFYGSSVIKIDGYKAETLLDTVKLPATQITSVVIGGKNLDELYVTSGSFREESDTDLPLPHGATFRVTGVKGVKGLPGDNFRLD